MPLPQSSTLFPTPTGSSFPASPAAQDPMFGVNPYSPFTNMQTGSTTSFIDPSLGIPDLAARRAAQQSQIQMAQLASMGLAPETDPHTWTPEEAANQTDAAIAKIATANPEAAQQLMDARGTSPEEDGGGFWDSLKDVAGDILSPALNIGGKVLEVIGRTAYIVPNIAFDLADGGETDVWGDVGGALSGNTKHNWNSVFQEMGWEGDGIGGFLRATVGFAADITTDPLSWVIPAGAGVKSATAAGHVAEEAAVHSASLVDEGAKLYGLADDALATKMTSRYREVAGKMETQGIRLGEDDTSVRLAGLIAEEPHAAERALLGRQFELADRVYRLNRSRSLNTYLAKNKGFYDDAGNLLAESGEVRTALTDAVARGGGAGHGSTAWTHARAIASSMGGSRFKVAVPFTELRYISPALPGSRYLSEKSLGVVSRFAAGQSGLNRMASYIAAHPDEGWAPMRDWMEQGFSKAQELHPDAINQLRGKFKGLGSMYYAASESMGGITQHFDSTAAVTRRGLAGSFASDAKTAAANELNHWARNTAYAVTDKNGNRLSREQLLRRMEATLGVSFRKKHNVASEADLERFDDYLDLFPHDLDTADPDAIRAWWDSQPQQAIGPQTAEEAARRDDELRHALETAAGLNDAQRETLDNIAAINEHMRNEMSLNDASYGDVAMGFGQVGKLTAEQAEQAATGSAIPETLHFVPRNAQQASRVKQVGITGDDAIEQGDFLGLHFDITPGGAPVGPGSTPVRVKVQHPIYVDESEAGALLDETIAEADNAARAATTASADARDAALGRPQGTTEATGEALQSRAQMVTEKIRKEHPEADSVVIKRADGSVHVVVFDQQNVWAVDDTAANMVAKRGFFHRTFAKDMREWLRGKVPKDGNKLLIAEPELEAFLKRQTLHMNRRQAETFMREYLGNLYGTEGMPARVWENDLLKVHEHYVQTTGEAIVSEQLGKSARRIVALGDLAPGMFGSAPRDQRYEWMMSPTLLSALRTKDSKLTRAIMASHSADYRRMEEQQAALTRTAEQYGMLQAMVEESLGHGVEVPDRLVAAARRYGETTHKAQRKIEKNIAGLDETETHLVGQLDAYLRAEADEGVRTDPLLGHPGPEDPVRIEQLEDGRQRIYGWHGRLDPTNVEESSWPTDLTEMANGGFHFGSFEQARARLESLAGTNAAVVADAETGMSEYKLSRSIGFRDGRDWPVEEVDVTPRLDPIPGESNADFTERVLAQETVTEMRPVQPDLFYDDLMQPVVVEGNFQGGKQGTPVWSENQAEMAPFSGSDYGWSIGKAQGRGELEGNGFDGIVYANSVENGAAEGEHGWSVMVLDPSRVSVAKGPERFEDAVAKGKVFVGPDGKTSTVRVKGSKRLRPRGELVSDLGRVRAERDELRALQKSLKEGDDTVVRRTGKEVKTKLERTGEVMQVTVGKGDDQSFVRAMIEGDVLRIQSITVPTAVRRQGHATAMYQRLAEAADKLGLELRSDLYGQRTADAEALWEGLQRQGLPVHQVEGERGPEWVLGHVAKQPSTREVADSAAGLGREVAARAKRESQMQYAAGKRLEKLRRKTHDAMGEANKAYAEFHGAVAKTKPSLVKVETAGNLGGLTRLHVAGLEGFAMPAYIAEEFHTLVDRHGIGHLRESWRKYVMGPWKRWATYRWPGFHVRNFFGAFFNNWLGGVVERDYVFSWRVNHASDGHLKWAERKVNDWEMANYNLKYAFGGERPTYAQVSDLLAKQGVGRANTMAVMGIGSATEATHDAFVAAGKANANVGRRAARRADGVMKNMGSSVEDFHRVAAWGRGMAATNGDTYGARAFVMMRHGDYADLTGAEDFIRDLVPFYKWQRTNIPYQLRMLAENPSKLSLVHDKVPGYAYDAQGINRQEAEMQQADWMKQTTAIPIPSWVPVVGSKDKDALKFAMFDLPYSDLYNGLGDYLSSGLPVVRNVLESYGFKQTLFSGKALTGEYVPLSGVFNLPGVRDILHTVGLTQRGADGREYMEDKMQNVLMGWPIFSRFRNFTESDPERVDSRVGGLFSMIAGVGIREGDYTSAELDFFYNEVRPLLDQYKSLGIRMPTVDEIQSGETGSAVGLFSGVDPESPFLNSGTAA